jgi:mono/diheme cytochrome c family protein
MPAQFPPLAGSEWVNAAGPNRVIRIALHGLTGPIQVKGQDWDFNMVPFGDILSDAELAAVISHVRNSFGNSASMVKPEQVKAVREKTAGRSQAWTAPELQAVAEND